MALAVSVVTFLIISILDTVADHLGNSVELASDATEGGLRHVIGALGILVGFSWEQVLFCTSMFFWKISFVRTIFLVFS